MEKVVKHVFRLCALAKQYNSVLDNNAFQEVSDKLSKTEIQSGVLCTSTFPVCRNGTICYQHIFREYLCGKVA